MPNEDEIEIIETDHPWLDLPEDSVDEVVRFSLDEIRIG